MTKSWNRLFQLSVLTLSLGSIGLAHADVLHQATVLEQTINRDAANSQKVVTASSDRTQSMKMEIAQLREEIQNTTVYRDHLAKLTENQQQEKASLKAQLAGIQTTRQGLIPLMYQMLSTLQTLVEAGGPVHQTARSENVQRLNVLMNQANISNAEKFREILTAYQQELTDGTSLGWYQGLITLLDHQTREANILFLGHVSILARSLDEQTVWLWNAQSQRWQTLNDVDQSQITKAFSIAKKDTAPELISLPLSIQLEKR